MIGDMPTCTVHPRLQDLLCESLEVGNAPPFESTAADLVISSTQRRAGRAAEHPVGHVEQYVVLFRDVGDDQVDESLCCIAQFSTSDRITISRRIDARRHVTYERSPKAVLVEHHRDRTRVSRHSLGYEPREQKVLLLAVVTCVGEEAEKGDASVNCVVVKGNAAALASEHVVESSSNLEDELVLFPQNRRR